MAPRFRQYQAFHAIIDTGTVTGAAEALGVSQPAISNLIAQLERQTKLKLFERQRGRLVPTPEAAVLFQEVDTVVRGLDHVTQAVVDLQNQKAGQLQVATSHALAFGFMPGEVARFLDGRTNLTVAFQSQYSSKIQEWVAAGLFEIGICELPLRQDGLERREFSYEVQCVVPASSPLVDHTVLTPTLLSEEPFIVMGADHMVTSRTREAFQAEGARLRFRGHTDLFRNALNLVKQGLGVALVDPFTLLSDDGQGYVVRPFKPLILLDMFIVTARGRPLSAVGREFLDVLESRLAAMAWKGGA
ncbi:MAG: LysR family transcriptional regulator [Silicimonas sp.]|nr:LysR family transcriptional regulator [Silicimonas sp.]